MTTSPETDKINAALVKAHAAMAPVIADASNEFLKTKYATLGAVLKVVMPPLHAHGMTIIQGGDPSNDGGLLVTTRLIHESGQWLEMSCPAPLTKKDGHGLGSAITYARRYNLLAFAGVAQEDDDGNSASNIAEKDRRDKESLQAVVDSQLKEIGELIHLLDAPEDKVAATCRKYSEDRTSSPEGLMKNEAKAMITAMRAAVKKSKAVA